MAGNKISIDYFAQNLRLPVNVQPHRSITGAATDSGIIPSDVDMFRVELEVEGTFNGYLL